MLVATITGVWGWRAARPTPKAEANAVQMAPGMSEDEGPPWYVDLKLAQPELLVYHRPASHHPLYLWTPVSLGF